VGTIRCTCPLNAVHTFSQTMPVRTANATPVAQELNEPYSQNGALILGTPTFAAHLSGSPPTRKVGRESADKGYSGLDRSGHMCRGVSKREAENHFPVLHYFTSLPSTHSKVHLPAHGSSSLKATSVTVIVPFFSALN
jgi:hypothetical protein